MPQWIDKHLGSNNLTYLIAALIGAAPIPLSIAVDAWDTVSYSGYQFRGYGKAYNWMAFVVILPVSVFLVRLATRRMTGSTTDGGMLTPPIAEVAYGSSEAFVARFRRVVLGRPGILVALATTVALTFVDVLGTIAIYLDNNPAIEQISEKDWSIMFLTGAPTPAQNLLLVATAWTVQAVPIFLGIWLLIVMVLHNGLFLSALYQRSRSGSEPREGDLVLRLDDHADRCFGLRSTYRAFNTQVVLLVSVGFVMTVSRYVNVDVSQSERVYGAIGSLGGLLKLDLEPLLQLIAALDLRALFNDVGQWMLLGGWIALFFVVASPSLMKLLPFIRRRRLDWLVGQLLREMFPDSQLRWRTPEPSEKQLEDSVSRFAQQSFWPTGDSRARVLFWGAIFVFLILLVPLRYSSGRLLSFLCWYIALLSLAWFLSRLLLLALRFPLTYVSPRLVEEKEEG